MGRGGRCWGRIGHRGRWVSDPEVAVAGLADASIGLTVQAAPVRNGGSSSSRPARAVPRSSRPPRGSVAGGAEPVDDALRDPTPRRDIDLVRPGPRADGLSAVVDDSGRLRGGGDGPRAALSATDLPRG